MHGLLDSLLLTTYYLRLSEPTTSCPNPNPNPTPKPNPSPNPNPTPDPSPSPSPSPNPNRSYLSIKVTVPRMTTEARELLVKQARYLVITPSA